MNADQYLLDGVFSLFQVGLLARQKHLEFRIALRLGFSVRRTLTGLAWSVKPSSNRRPRGLHGAHKRGHVHHRPVTHRGVVEVLGMRVVGTGHLDGAVGGGVARARQALHDVSTHVQLGRAHVGSELVDLRECKCKVKCV